MVLLSKLTIDTEEVAVYSNTNKTEIGTVKNIEQPKVVQEEKTKR